MRDDKYGSSTIDLNQLRQCCRDNKNIAEDQDQLFVCKFYIGINEKETSQRLLQETMKTTHLATDATYKLMWQGFPVLMIGTTDKDRRYHPFGLAIRTNE